MSDSDPAKPSAEESKAPAARQSLWKRRRFTILFTLGMAAVIIGALWSQAGDFFNNMKAANARKSLEQGDFDEALEQVNAAMEADEDAVTFLELRAQIYLRMSEEPDRDTKPLLEKSLADWDRLLTKNNSYRRGYLMRAEVRQRLGRHDEAIADGDEAGKWVKEVAPDADNARAYFRARANKDIETATKLADKAVGAFDLSKLKLDEDYQEDNGAAAAQFLDTRGYVYYRAGRKQEALADLELAVKLFEAERTRVLKAADDESEARRKRIERELNHNLAVLLHHRGLAQDALGNKEAAKADQEKSLELGYNEEKGIF